MDSLCTFCINQKTVNKDFECKTSRCDENCKKYTSDTQQLRKQTDELIKVCQKSISHICNQQIYMKQFIDHQVTSLILQLQERQAYLQNQLSETLQKKLDFYADCESRLTNIKKCQEYSKLRQQQFTQLQLYEDDKFMDFSNIKILTEEIKQFGKKIIRKNNCKQNTMTKKNVYSENKENQIDTLPKNQFLNFLPDLSQFQLHYKLGQKFTIPKQNRVIGFIYANGCKFGWYYECENPVIGFTECYLFSLENIQNIPPMKFYPKDGHQKYSLYLHNQKIGFGKDCKDLLIDFENLQNSSSSLGYSYDLYSELDGDYVLAGRPNNWNIEMIEIFGSR